MDLDEAEVGMRVAFTGRAKRVKGIILMRRDKYVEGMITGIGEELIRVHWDDNEVGVLNPYWVSPKGVQQIERERVERRSGWRGPRKRVLVPKETV